MPFETSAVSAAHPGLPPETSAVSAAHPSLPPETSAVSAAHPSLPPETSAVSPVRSLLPRDQRGLLTDKLSVEELWNRVMRVAKPSLTMSAFAGSRASEIDLRAKFDEVGSREALLRGILANYAIYNANILALRGLQTVSRREPLGIHGESLHSAIALLPPDVWSDAIERTRYVSWVEDIVVDPADKLKYEEHKLLRSDSTLYFYDKYMRREDNVFSAENVNEGILHVLFYFVLFMSEATPKVFAIDNIETALNPQLCRDLMRQLAALADKHDKQALITTHNPAILDGINLHDDEQRLFVVSRSDDGHTRTRRIKAKPQLKEGKLKLSEMWMRGHLGGLPEGF